LKNETPKITIAQKYEFKEKEILHLGPGEYFNPEFRKSGLEFRYFIKKFLVSKEKLIRHQNQ
jgi:hypothetical protein